MPPNQTVSEPAVDCVIVTGNPDRQPSAIGEMIVQSRQHSTSLITLRLCFSALRADAPRRGQCWNQVDRLVVPRDGFKKAVVCWQQAYACQIISETIYPLCLIVS